MSNRSYLIIFTIILISSSTIYAMPPRPGIKLSAAEVETRAQLGIDIIKNPVRDIGKRGIYNTPGDVQPLVSGTKKFPVVCIKFPDYANTYGTANFDSMLFTDNWASGSAKKYYNDVSYSVFTLQGNVSSWYTSDNNKAYYGYSNGDARAAALAKEAATKADASIDYSLYDNDHDGYVDVFTCLHAGYGMEETSNGADIWSHSWSFSYAGIGVYTTYDPDPVNGGYIKIDDYVIDPEQSNYTNHGSMVCIGVFCHEWGHALGLPDLYDTSPYPYTAGEGLGNWCIMAAGSWGGDGNSPWKPVQMCAWAKMDLGWLNPTAVRSRGLYSIPYVETNSKAYWLIGRQRTFKEYFLVENRRKVLTDTFLYNPGLLIYHIDDSVIARQRSTNRVNAKMSGAWKYGVALEQADGLDELYSGADRGDANDPWPGGLGKTLFDSTSTTPNTRTNYPTTNLVTSSFVKNIPAASPTMSCTLASGAVGQFSGGPDASGYKWIDSDTTGGPMYSWIDISQTGTALGTGDDALYWFRLPYTFKFYGTNYDTVWVSTNGWLSFGINPGGSVWTNATIPTATAPNRAVFAFWDDLNVVAVDNANMYYQVFGNAPDRYCVITWNNVERRASAYPFNQLTFQVILYENGKITLQYKDCAVGDTTYNWGRSASVGIENSIGSVGLQYLYNGSPIGNLLASERAIQFYPSIKDVGVTAIENPTGSIDSSSTIIPRTRVKNFGTNDTTFNVTFIIGSIYTDTRSKTLIAGVEDTVNFLAWQPVRGIYQTRCSTFLVNDVVPGNDTLGGSVLVNVHDVGVTAIEYPSGLIDSAGAVVPRARVKNYGSNSETFNVTYRIIGTSYNQSRSKTLSAGNEDTVNFASWIPIRGSYTTRCSVYLSTDVAKVNDTLCGSVIVNVTDVGVAKIITPVGTFDSLTNVTPACSVYNYGTTTQTYLVRMKVGSFYNDTVRVLSQAGSEKDYIEFSPHTNWPRGSQAVTCSTELADANPLNDIKTGTIFITVTIPTLWTQKESIPTNVASKYVKDGGAFVVVSGTKDGDVLYTFRGQKSKEFYKYYPIGDSWSSPNAMESIPWLYKPGTTTLIKKYPTKGAALCWNGNDTIYATKGGSTREFWAYSISGNNWVQKEFVPPLKGVKGGTSMVFKDGKVYLLAGSRPKPDSNNFYAYTPSTHSWGILDKLPPGPYNKVWRDGSCLALFNNTVYALKGSDKQGYFYRYDTPSWTSLPIDSIPKVDTLRRADPPVRLKITNKTPKYGASMASSGSTIYIIKGGGSTALWKWTVSSGFSMSTNDTIPRLNNKSLAKTGAALAYANGVVWLLKGNNTPEFWQYVPSAISNVKLQISQVITNTQEELTLAQVAGNKLFEITPNPVTKNSVVKFNLTQSGGVEISLYNSVGQIQSILIDREFSGGSYSIPLNRLSLIKGIYFVKVKVGDSVNTIKLIVE